MPHVTFVFPDRPAATLAVREGTTVMRASVDNKLPGIRGACGGAALCGTCHVYVNEPWLGQLPPPNRNEINRLAEIAIARPDSRLGCQIKLTEALDGLTLRLPERQGRWPSPWTAAADGA